MSRSWERKVQKNRTELNKQRKKQGQPSISNQGVISNSNTYKGRKYVFPFILIMLGTLYGMLGWATSSLPDTGNTTSPVMTWVVTISYIVLAVILFMRRPYLQVNKDNLQTTKLSKVRVLSASNIARIKISKGSAVIETKDKGSNWVFTRLINRYNIHSMGEGLEKFATENNIPFEK
ncbi:hypothetical protein [Paenibacillus sp. CMAA1364]